MASHHAPGMRGIRNAFGRLNIITAAALCAFFAATLTMLGLTSDLAQLMETYRWLPFAASMCSLFVIFVSSGTRDPSFYHPIELSIVAIGVAMMAMYAFLDAFVSFLGTYEPISTVVVFAYLLIVSAIIAR